MQFPSPKGLRYIAGHLTSELGVAMASRYYADDFDPIESFPEREWDTMILLDACRYDLMLECKEFCDDFGPCSKIYSNAGHTPEFLFRNFFWRESSDIVYLTASPHLSWLGLGFHERLNIWRSHWDNELGTVTPETMCELIEATRTLFPDKRLLAHFMQPHHPFIGDVQLNEQHGLDDDEAGLGGELTVWEKLGTGDLKRDEVTAAYLSNLKRALNALRDVLPLPGKTVITSDHGNAYAEPVGPLTACGHGGGWRFEGVSAVPWLEVEGEQRGQNEETVDRRDRLQNLGYL